MFFIRSLLAATLPAMPGSRPPPSILGLTRWEFEGGGLRFRIWARPILGRGGVDVVPVTLVWRREDGTGGIARCGGLVEAMARAAELSADLPA